MPPTPAIPIPWQHTRNKHPLYHSPPRHQGSCRQCRAAGSATGDAWAAGLHVLCHRHPDQMHATANALRLPACMCWQAGAAAKPPLCSCVQRMVGGPSSRKTPTWQANRLAGVCKSRGCRRLHTHPTPVTNGTGLRHKPTPLAPPHGIAAVGSWFICRCRALQDHLCRANSVLQAASAAAVV